MFKSAQSAPRPDSTMVTWKQILNWHWQWSSCHIVMEHYMTKANGDGIPNSFYGCPLYQVPWHLHRFEANGMTKVVRVSFVMNATRRYHVDLTSAEYVIKRGRHQAQLHFKDSSPT